MSIPVSAALPGHGHLSATAFPANTEAGPDWGPTTVTSQTITTPNQGHGQLKAFIGVYGRAVGGDYLVDGHGALAPGKFTVAGSPVQTPMEIAYGAAGQPVALTGHGSLRDTYVIPTQLVFFPVTGNYVAVADPSISGDLNSPVVQPISALVTFTPRLDQGEQLYVSNYLITPAYNALQVVNLLGFPVSGTWTLEYGGYTTTALAWDAGASDVQAALVALPSIGASNVVVVDDVEPRAYDVQFTNALGLRAIPTLVGNADLLVNDEGSGFCEITVTPTALGSVQVAASAAVSIPPLTARIWNGVLSTIDFADTPGFQLTANIPQLNIGGGSDGNGNLIYDVTFSSITFNGANQFLAPFAFQAPTDNAPVCLTDPNLERLPYRQSVTVAVFGD
jgi:hypothetical protein